MGGNRRAQLSRRAPGRASLVVVLTALLTLAACGFGPDVVAPSASTCLPDTSPASLSTLLDREPGGIIAADYQRAVPLPDGRTLWLFQDATIRLAPPPDPPAPTTTVPDQPPPPPPPTERLLHNIGMVQTGTCFEVLRSGTASDPGPWLFAASTAPFFRWFWPLDATMGDDGKLYVFVAEMAERGPLYLSITEPVATRIAGIDLSTMRVTFQGTPPNDSASLYGFSIATDAAWSYLYAQCHRQFGWDIGPFGVPAHDLSCAGDITVGRVPSGRPFDAPTYWDGVTWQANPARAVAVIPKARRSVNPSQVRWIGDEFVAVTKVDDWFGTTIHLDRAPSAQGPWTNYMRVPATPKCSTRVCNTYFASWVPWDHDGDFIIGLSHNRWDGQVSAVNRPSFLTAPRPRDHAFALRCDLVDC